MNIDPRDLEILQAHVYGKDSLWLRTHTFQPTKSQAQKLSKLISQRSSGMPLEYLIGRRAFFGRDFIVGKGVLIPRPETEELVEYALKLIPKNTTTTILEIGCGSGCIAVSIAAERPKARIIAVDRSPIAIRYSRINIRRHLVSKQINLRLGDLLTDIKKEPDLLVANLPYLKPNEISLVPHEPKIALIGGRDGMKVFAELFFQIVKRNWKIPMLLEIDPRRSTKTAQLAQKYFPWATVELHHDLAGRSRILSILPIGKSLADRPVLLQPK